ncbi:MAG TPA: hypothetical protein VLM40_19865, partial [Gemmata sp.]|nr:hypothetical protein [Gemmata sp.]
AGAKVNAADDHGVTPLSQACENASVALVEKLLQPRGQVEAVHFTSVLESFFLASGTARARRCLPTHRRTYVAALAAVPK